MPTCSICPTAKQIAREVAQRYGLTYREVDMNTKEGLDESFAYQIMSTPSIVLNNEVIVMGRIISKEKLEEEVRKRIEKWKVRASIDKG